VESRTLQLLEYDRIKEMLREEAVSPTSKELVEKLIPQGEKVSVLNSQRETSEAKNMLEAGFRRSFFPDIRKSLQKTGLEGSVLLAEELVAINDFLKAARQWKSTISPYTAQSPHLSSKFKQIKTFPALEKVIQESIGSEGEIMDGASSNLRKIRHHLREVHAHLQDRLNNILHSPTYQKIIQEPIITIRHERYVIPIKQPQKGNFPGIVHAQSTSGATLFVEPLSVVDLNNELQEYCSREQEEIERILTEITSMVRENLLELRDSLEVLSEIDLIFAKASLSIKMNAIEPRFNDQGYIYLRAARHPLLPLESVVPVDVELGKDFLVLALSGPNNGGKTVALKTVGLLSLMAQAGLHIPVAEGSELGIFPRIFADIGDEQSILYRLSSFSAHILRLCQILEKADAHTLVLLDELATGTDPAEGVALGKAILENLLAREARTVITTHYWELKTFAHQHPRMRNASVEFDPVTLQPTYKLRIGVPGRSNALAMAVQEGLSPEIVNRAREFLGDHRLKLEELIAQLEEDHREIEREKRSVEIRSREIEARQEELFQELNVLKQQRKSVREKALQEAKEIVRDAQRRVEELMHRLGGNSSDRQMLEETRLTLKKESEKISEELYPSSLPSEPVKDLRVGEKVRFSRWNQVGEVVSILPDQWAMVRVGEVKVKVPFVELERLLDTEKKASEEELHLTFPVVRDKLDVRGLKVEEAVAKVDKYLDEAYLSGLTRITLIHGIGTGALRKAISEMLADHPHVANFCLGEPNEGGKGVTIVSLK